MGIPKQVADSSDSFCGEPSSSVVIETSPENSPTLPPWFAEFTLVVQTFQRWGIPQQIVDQVRLVRGRAGTYEVLDFFWYLIAYTVSGERTMEQFACHLHPFTHLYLALIQRTKLPNRATVSRFLKDVTPECVAALRQVMEHTLLTHGLSRQAVGGLWDHQGERWVFMDVDATRQVARQRSLTTDSDYPPPRRRTNAVCAPGYTGRKRGECVRSRTVVSQPFTQEWLGSWSGRGNGQYIEELSQAVSVIGRYFQTHAIPLHRGVLRLDGLYGTTAALTHVQQAGLGFLVRCKDYHLLKHPQVRQAVQQTTPTPFRSPDSQTSYEVFDAGTISDWQPKGATDAVCCRVIVMRHTAPANPDRVKVGKLVKKEWAVYELFVTTIPATALSTSEVVHLYHQRCGFEQVLADEDQEQNMDRWYSGHPYGQEYAQILAQMMWNVRTVLGHQQQDRAMRWTFSTSENETKDVTAEPPDGRTSSARKPDATPSCQETGSTIPMVPENEGPPHLPEEQSATGTAEGAADDHHPRGFLPDDSHVSERQEPAAPGDQTRQVVVQMSGDACEEHHPEQMPEAPNGDACLVAQTAVLAPEQDDGQGTEASTHTSFLAWVLALVNAVVSGLLVLKLQCSPAPSRWRDQNQRNDKTRPAILRERNETHQGVPPGPPEEQRQIVLSQAHNHQRYSGGDFRVEADGTVRCPAGHILTAQRTRQRPNGTTEVRFAARIGDCRDCPLREQCVPKESQSPRTITGTYQNEQKASNQGANGRAQQKREHAPQADEEADVAVLVEPRPPVVWKTETIWWCDGGGRAVRRRWYEHVRWQQVTITEEPGAPPPQPVPGPKDGVYTRNQRAHRRLSWKERMARNARPVTAPRYRIHIAGIPSELAIALGLKPSLG